MKNALIVLLHVISIVGLSTFGLSSCSNNTKSVADSLTNADSLKIKSDTILPQSIKDYYIASEPNYNKASFHIALIGKTTSLMVKKVIYYLRNNDGGYDISDVTIASMPTVHGGKWLPTAIGTRTVQFTTTEVKMSKSVSSDMSGVVNKKVSYEPPQVLLIMPPATWSIPDGGDSKDRTDYTSTWTKVIVGGISKKAIKVEELWTGWNNLEHLKPPKGTTTTYYVEGIGEMKTEDLDDKLRTNSREKFDSLSLEPRVQDKLKTFMKEFIEEVI